MSKTLTLNLDSLWEDGYIYTEYDIGGRGHSVTIVAEDKESFLDAFSQEWRKRAEEALEDDEEQDGIKWCKEYNCWCNDVEEITEDQYQCDLECKLCGKCSYI